MTTLLTGASGFIGRPVMVQLLEQGQEVVALSSRSRKSEHGETWAQADALDAAAMIDVVRDVQPERVIHLAWECGRYDDAIHLHWLAATLDWVAVLPKVGCQHLLTAGSSMECWADSACRETMSALEPNTLYGEAKLALGRLCSAICRRAGIGHAHPRIFFVCGPGQTEGKLISGAIRAVLEGRPFTCNNGHAWRDYLEVEDVARVLAALSARQSEGIVNVGSGRAVQLGELMRVIGDVLEQPDLIDLATPPADTTRDLAEADVTRLRDMLGAAPTFDPHRAIERIVQQMRVASTMDKQA